MEIDEGLRNRVVGASIVTILAMIFLPMLVDDPKENILQTEWLSIPKKLEDTPSLTATLLADDDRDDFAIQPLAIPSKKVPLISESQQSLPSVSTESVQKITQTNRWFIQVASFNREENAFTFKDKLKDQGFFATVSPALSKGRSVYRVRVGPELDKQRANDIKRKLNQLNNVESIIILSN